jgi:3-methylcrotonyl-CoA carboxylase alpha subunit
VTAPIPGRITRALVQPGDVVEENAPLVVIEAMKMTLRAPRADEIASVRHGVDEMAEEGTELVTFVAQAGG